MNKVKEKKLNAIKADILEVKDFVMSNSINNRNQISSDDDLEHKPDNTITLTKIVDFKNNGSNLNILANIKEDIGLLKSILIGHNKILKEILHKIK